MPKLVILGTSYSIPDETHENTHMVLVGEDRKVLIDCVSNPIVRLKQAGIDHHDITDVVMTHFHPDHVSGLPLLLMGMGLSERVNPLNIYGLKYVVDIMKNMLVDYQWERWHQFPVTFHYLEDQEMFPMLESEEFRIFTSPVNHFIPTIGMRIEFTESNQVLAYSCDTTPTKSVVVLGENADVLIHEAAGASPGHSSASQAGEIATKANAKELYLIHYPTGDFDYHALVDQAAQTYDGPIRLAEDLMVFEFE
ncbi:MAG: MBL fold metallo-hydrolase [Anaerolineae bacterium]|nr:MBL fold metallo-hydrolase [Anaerolineae bacterium]